MGIIHRNINQATREALRRDCDRKFPYSTKSMFPSDEDMATLRLQLVEERKKSSEIS